MNGEALAALELPAITGRLATASATELGAELARVRCSRRPILPRSRERQALTAEAVALLDAAARAVARRHRRRARDRRARRARRACSARRSCAQSRMRSASGSRRGASSASSALWRRCSTSGSRRSIPRSLRSPTRSTAASRRTARTCATPRRPSCADCAASCGTAAPASARSSRASRARLTCSEALQEQFLAERGGRPVLAVRATSRSKVPGIVHDASSSGQTLFVEPFAVVELNNRLAEAAAEAREEVERILRELSASVAAHADALVALVETTADVDVVARLAARSRALARRAGDGVRRRAPARRAPPAARPRDRRADRPRPRPAARGRDQRPEHGRQDGRAEDARPRRAAAPVRAATARRRRRRCRCSTACSPTSATGSRSR